MKPTVKIAIYKALIDNHWLNVTYKNCKGEIRNWYLGINDIDIAKGKLHGEIFNAFKDTECISDPKPLSLDNFEDAVVMEETYYPTKRTLMDKLGDTKSDLYKYLEVDTMDNNILKYLVECYKHDNDPFLKDRALIDGIIPQEFIENEKYDLTESQFNEIMAKVFKNYKNDNLAYIQETQQMGMNVLSINIGDKQFVVAYRTLSINFKSKTLKLSKDISFNKTFMIDESPVSLSYYLDISPDDFIKQFPEKHRELIEEIKETFTEGERINTDTSIFLLARRSYNDLERACNSIKEMEDANLLTQPLKAFFGRSRPHTGTSKNPYIVISDSKKINIDQMRVVFNSMVNHITYVKGPPGTGKTETIFNVVLSAMANDKKVLICSNNNHPLNDIYAKLTSSFTYHNRFKNIDEPLMFPALRIYNNEDTPKTLETLEKILEYAKSNKDRKLDDTKTNDQKELSLAKNSTLKGLLKEYEENQTRLEDLERLIKLKELSSSEKISAQIEGQIAIKKDLVKKARKISDEEVASFATSAKEDNNYRNYLYFSFMKNICRLLNPAYKELRNIVEEYSVNIQQAVKDFNAYLRTDESLKRLTDVFPVLICTNNSSDKLGSPSPHFDLTIMDEAGQCNLASSLIPIVRGTDLLLVGDTNQLQPVTILDGRLNEKYRNEYGIKKEYDYISNSILSTMISRDRNSKSLLLRYHYRCGKKIATFPNARYYNDQLKLLNENQGKLVYQDVKNRVIPGQRNSYYQEAKEIVDIVKSGKYKDVGIITPFLNQSNLINDLLAKEGITGVRAGTIHTLQGSEKSTIILSSALSLRTAKKTMEWIENNSELLNVAVTRAKDTFIFVGDKEAIEKLSKGKNTDLKALSDYVASNGEMIPAKSDKIIITDFSNDSESEKMFFDTVKPYFNRRGTKFRISRNVPIREAIKNVSAVEERSFGHKEFDVVIETSQGFLNRKYAPIVVFEIDGGEHVGSRKTAQLDRQKEEICGKHCIKLIRIANNDVKDYEMIIQVFEQTAGLVDKSQEMIQGSLFDDKGNLQINV